MFRPAVARCRRCGRADRLVTDDGPPICRVCIIAWGAFARVVVHPSWVKEPGIVELRHREHLGIRLDCPSCLRAAVEPGFVGRAVGRDGMDAP